MIPVLAPLRSCSSLITAMLGQHPELALLALQLIAEDKQTPPKAITFVDTSPANAQQPCQTFT
jgi:hypothetical protein